MLPGFCNENSYKKEKPCNARTCENIEWCKLVSKFLKRFIELKYSLEPLSVTTGSLKWIRLDSTIWKRHIFYVIVCQRKHILIIYSPSCSNKAVWLSYFCETHKDNLKNIGNQTTLNPIDFHCTKQKPNKSNTFFKITSFVFCGRG